MSVLVVGSVALDSVETPSGSVRDVLGGSAIYFAASASLYTEVNLVGVVGTDFPQEHTRFLTERGVDVMGLKVVDGQTFRWAGRYNELGAVETLQTHLNVFADFHPTLPPGYERSDMVFLGNIDPDLQGEVLRQVKGPKLVMMDTMDFWIRGKRESLYQTMGTVDVVTMNESEVRLLTGKHSIISAARGVLELGPKAVIIKRGEYGSIMLSEDGYFIAPAYPVAYVKDPTGAGDSFAGGILGYLDGTDDFSPQALRKAIVHGTIMASYTVSEFSIDGLRSLNKANIAQRYQEFKGITQFEDKESTQ